MARNFKIGDRVVGIGVYCTRKIDGLKGKVVKTVSLRGEIGVEFDKNISGHTCDNAGKNGHCWYVSEEQLKHSGDECIVIYRNGEEVIALDKTTGKKATAKCSPDDKFDFNVGAKLALERLTESVTFRLLCISDWVNLTKRGKVYNFIDGYTRWEDGRNSSHYDDVNEFKHYNKDYDRHFIELKDGDDPEEILKKYDKSFKVGDRVKVINTGRCYTTYANFFKENNVPYEIAVLWACGDDLGYEKGVKVLHDTFTIKFIFGDKAIIQCKARSKKCYLLDLEGLEKC